MYIDTFSEYFETPDIENMQIALQLFTCHRFFAIEFPCFFYFPFYFLLQFLSKRSRDFRVGLTVLVKSGRLAVTSDGKEPEYRASPFALKPTELFCGIGMRRRGFRGTRRRKSTRKRCGSFNALGGRRKHAKGEREGGSRTE